MATQIRKFEQEAIVDTIADKIETELKSKRQEMIKDDRDYESMLALDINRYQGVLSLNPKLNSYHLKEKIGNKVAIALLPKDAIENMDTIISNITKEFV